MPWARRAICGSIVATLAFLLSTSFAMAAIERPNALDRRVDTISTSALLAQPATALIDPARQAAAQRLVRWKLPGWFLAALLQIAALAYFWSSGTAAKVRDAIRRRTGSEALTRFAFGAALGLIARLAALAPDFYLYRVDRIMDLTVELTRMWALFWVLHTLLAMIVTGLLALFVLMLVDRTHQWYLYTIAAIFLVSIGYAYASPVFEVRGLRNLEPVTGSLAQPVQQLLTRANLRDVGVFIEPANRLSAGGAVVAGLGPSARVIVPDTLVAGSTPAEVLFAIAYELGHINYGDPFSIALVEAAIVVVGSALAVVIADRIGFRRDDDPLSRLALVGALLALMYIFAIPVRNGALHFYDQRADSYAVALTSDRADAVRALIRSTDQRMDEVCPDLLNILFLSTQPGVGVRVATLNGVPNACP
jgi:STE24 endopeptidase